MLTYVYGHTGDLRAMKCTLGLKFEWKQSIKDPPLERCPECGSKVQRIPQAVAFKDLYWNKKPDIFDNGF